MDFEEYLYKKVSSVIKGWNEESIYAISFFVYTNESFVFNGHSNFPEFSIGYNTEKDCNYASQLSEERWNFAYWRQDMTEIITPEDNNEGARILYNWYQSRGIEDIGLEDFDNYYDENMSYIGKGPVGYYELLTVVSNVAHRLQSEGHIAKQFGSIPIIVHDLEYSWYVQEATENANPNGEAAVFLEVFRSVFL